MCICVVGVIRVRACFVFSETALVCRSADYQALVNHQACVLRIRREGTISITIHCYLSTGLLEYMSSCSYEA